MIKYIPFPVVAGLVTGIGLLMIKSQVLLLAKDMDMIWSLDLHSAVPLITALLTIIIILLVPKRFPKIPGSLAGLICGIVFFQVLVYFVGDAKQSWVVGSIPSLASLRLGITSQALKNLPWDIVVTASLALTVLATTDCLLTSVVADSRTGGRHNAKKEMAAQGIGHIMIGLMAGLGGGGTKGSTLVSIQSGGGRWSPVASGLLMIVLMIFAGSAGNYLPISALAGVIIFVGIGMVDLNVFAWLKNKNRRIDGAIALIVIATILAVNLVMAVAVGVAIAIIIFIRTQVKSPIIHSRVTAERYQSLCARTDNERQCLDVHGREIILIELRGNLFFATADRLLSEIEPDIFPGSIVILHFRRVKYIDLTGMILLLQIDSRIASEGSTLIVCHLRKELGFGKKVTKAFQQIDKKSYTHMKIFRDTDTAFEYAENLLLEREGCNASRYDQYKPLAENNLCRGMPESIVALIEKMPASKPFSKESTLFNAGDFGQSLFLVLKGEIEIRLYTGDQSYKRLAKYGPGTYFGEIAFLILGPRAATAVVTHDAEIMEIDREDIMKLDHKDKADLALHLLYEIGGTLGKELRRSAAEIYRLEQW